MRNVIAELEILSLDSRRNCCLSPLGTTRKIIGRQNKRHFHQKIGQPSGWAVTDRLCAAKLTELRQTPTLCIARRDVLETHNVAHSEFWR